MRPSSIAVLAAAAAGPASAATECVSGLHMIVARGTGEPEGTGSTGYLAKQVASRIKGSDIEGLDYPATMTDPDYITSVGEGSDEMRETVREYVKACPDTKVAVMGYSQGAQVATDAFCGGGDNGFDNEAALPNKLVHSSVVAIVLFGDPSHIANATYNKGTSKNDGIFDRDDISVCEDKLADRIVSYCDTGDVYCDAGDDRAVHGEYIERYGDEVVDFIVSRYESAESGEGDASTSATGTTTAKPTTAAPTGSASATDAATPTTPGADGGAATETGDPEDGASVIVPGLGLLGLLSVAVMGLM
ncbi:hypothetical protein ACO1O0_000096 [Amphichorda felina]